MFESLTKLTPLVCLAVALTGCRGESSEAPYDFIGRVDEAHLALEDVTTSGMERLLTDAFTFRSETRRALAARSLRGSHLVVGLTSGSLE